MVDANTIWHATLKNNREHPRWHDYSLHCESLGLGDAWRLAHENNVHMLSTFAGVEQVLEVAEAQNEMWITSDASEWVVKFKLKCVGIDSDRFAELFTVDRCGTNKSSPRYWESVRQLVKKSRLIYVENRLDKIHSALQVIPNCECIWVNEAEHGNVYKFGPIDPTLVQDAQVREAVHGKLKIELENLISESNIKG